MIDRRPAIVLDDRLARLRLSRGYVENVAAAVVVAALDERAAGATYGDTSRIRRDLGYAEPLTQAEGLRRAIEWEQIEQRAEPRVDYGVEDDVLRAVAP